MDITLASITTIVNEPMKLVVCIMDITLASITTIVNEPMYRTYIIGMQKSYA